MIGDPVGVTGEATAPHRALDPALFRLLALSIVAAVTTIALKTGAWLLTGSVGLLSDAAESLVNLVAAVAALGLLYVASRPADEDHAYGHAKAEYFSAGLEGSLIIVAALAIAVTAVDRLVHPQALTDVGVGLVVSAVASVVNLAVGLLLVRGGREHRSITVEADGRHLLTDVWTSAGVIVGVAAVALTGWERLDGIVALVVAANIVATGVRLLRRSVNGLMDRRIDHGSLQEVERVLAGFSAERGVAFHALRTRQAGPRSFISMHVLVPGSWTVQEGHDLCEEIETALHERLPHATVFTHLEPAEDPRSFDDTLLDRFGSPE